MNSVTAALEAAFGPATTGEPSPYADAECTNPFVSFAYAGPCADVAIDGLVRSVAERAKGGELILRTAPSLERLEDGRVMARARLTFSEGMTGTETDEARLPHAVRVN